ncbi:unnamed protein product, partial [Ceratitis capitata]
MSAFLPYEEDSPSCYTMDEKFSASSVTQILRELLSSFPEADDVVSQILADRMFRYGSF